MYRFPGATQGGFDSSPPHHSNESQHYSVIIGIIAPDTSPCGSVGVW